MTEGVTYRWVEAEPEGIIPSPQAERDRKQIEFVLEARGWMSLNKATSRILIAERGGVMIGFFVFQLVPMTGPVWLHPAERGTGVAEEMAHGMWDFLIGSGSRGWIAGAETAHGERLCEMFGMQKIDYPMYITVGMEPRLNRRGT